MQLNTLSAVMIPVLVRRNFWRRFKLLTKQFRQSLELERSNTFIQLPGGDIGYYERLLADIQDRPDTMWCNDLGLPESSISAHSNFSPAMITLHSVST